MKEVNMQLKINNIVKTFGSKEVLHGLSFQVEKGKALGLLGRNGAGKTTTIRLMMSLFEQNSGTIELNGEKFDPRNHQIGYLPEERGLYPKKKIFDQLMYLGQLRGMSKKALKSNIDYWLERLDVSEYKDKNLETLSKGNQQKVQLASTFLCSPDIIILDEPFSGLDPVNSQILKDIIYEQIKGDKLIIFSSHQMSYIEEFCEEIALIDQGSMILSGNLKEIKKAHGKNRLILRVVDQSAKEVYETLNRGYEKYVEQLEIRKNDVIIKLKTTIDKQQFLCQLVADKMDLELLAMYHPSLEDIFIESVGDL